MLGGLLCARRHSEATPAMKPVSGLSSIALKQKTTPALTLPIQSIKTNDHNIILKTPVNNGIDDEIVYTEERIRIGQGGYEYVDTASSFVGQGSYGVVYKGIRRSTKRIVAIKVVLSGDIGAIVCE